MTRSDQERRTSLTEGRRDDDLKLYERVAVLESIIGQIIPKLEADIKELNTDMKILMSMAERGKGALFIPAIITTSIVSALATWLIQKLISV